MSDGGSEVKPEVKPDVNGDPKQAQINIKVVAQDGSEVMFKIKRGTVMRKLMEAYAQRSNVATSGLRFLFDGNRISPEQSAFELHMEDNDVIDVMQEQTGGFQ